MILDTFFTLLKRENCTLELFKVANNTGEIYRNGVRTKRLLVEWLVWYYLFSSKSQFWKLPSFIIELNNRNLNI